MKKEFLGNIVVFDRIVPGTTDVTLTASAGVIVGAYRTQIQINSSCDRTYSRYTETYLTLKRILTEILRDLGFVVNDPSMTVRGEKSFNQKYDGRRT